MAQPARSKVVLADPGGSNRFCVGGGNEIRLYEWEVSYRRTSSRSVQCSSRRRYSTPTRIRGSIISAARPSWGSYDPSPGRLTPLSLI